MARSRELQAEPPHPALQSSPDKGAGARLSYRVYSADLYFVEYVLESRYEFRFRSKTLHPCWRAPAVFAPAKLRRRG